MLLPKALLLCTTTDFTQGGPGRETPKPLSPFGAATPQRQVSRPLLQLALRGRAGVASQPFGRPAPTGRPPNIQGTASSPGGKTAAHRNVYTVLRNEARCQGPRGSRVFDTGTETGKSCACHELSQGVRVSVQGRAPKWKEQGRERVGVTAGSPLA